MRSRKGQLNLPRAIQWCSSGARVTFNAYVVQIGREEFKRESHSDFALNCLTVSSLNRLYLRLSNLSDILWRNHMHSFLLKKIAFWLLGATLFATSALAQTVVLNNTILETPSGGLWVIAPTGKASYCQSIQNASGSPQSKCVPIGNIGVSTTGFSFSLVGSALFVVNKTSGALHSCTVVLLGSVNPSGGCAQVTTLAALQ